MEFQYYIENNLAKQMSSDRGEADALMKKAENRLEFSIKIRTINEKTASFIFEDIYECLHEASQSLMALKGYKPYSHEALISFLKEFFNFSKSDIYAFDRYRILRNKSVYRGEKISAESCRESMEFLMKFLPKIRKEFEILTKRK